MLVCRKSADSQTTAQHESLERHAPRKLGEGGPVFFPRRKPSALARALLAQTEQVTAYDELWFAGRPSV